MVFSYYWKLTPSQRRVYRKSDEIHAIRLPSAEKLWPLIPAIARALERQNRERSEELCQKLATGMVTGLKLPRIRVKVLAVRPSKRWGELHGLYEPVRGRAAAVVTVWMRTAKKRQVVAFRSFLRTVLHEVCHHLDYEYLELEDSFHTEGFYKRESSLFHQLVDSSGKKK